MAIILGAKLEGQIQLKGDFCHFASFFFSFFNSFHQIKKRSRLIATRCAL